MPRSLIRTDSIHLLWIFCFMTHYSIPLPLQDWMCRPGLACEGWSGSIYYADTIMLVSRGTAQYYIVIYYCTIVNSSYHRDPVLPQITGRNYDIRVCPTLGLGLTPVCSRYVDSYTLTPITNPRIKKSKFRNVGNLRFSTVHIYCKRIRKSNIHKLFMSTQDNG